MLTVSSRGQASTIA